MEQTMQFLLNEATLISLLNKHLGLNLARIKCLSSMILALLEVKCINLSRLTGFFLSYASPDSRYRRMQRFVKEIQFPPHKLARLLIHIMELDEIDKFAIILDRTNWKFGKKDCNILYLAIAYKGIAIPLFWLVLEDKKKGNSDYNDRIKLIKLFIDEFGINRIEYILGDREFIGKNWVEWLKIEKISYCLRIKENGQYISSARGGMLKAADLFRDLKLGHYCSLGIRRICQTDTYRCHVSAFRSDKNELIVLIHTPDIDKPWEVYKVRWEIEVLFRAIKTGGFDLESTHITEFKRLDTILGIVAIACCIAHRTGEFYLEFKNPKLKNHGYKPHSIVRYGLDCLIEIIRKTYYSTSEVIQTVLRCIRDRIFFRPKLAENIGLTEIVM